MSRPEQSRVHALKDTTARWLLVLGMGVAAAMVAHEARADCAADVMQLQEAVKTGDRSAFTGAGGEGESNQEDQAGAAGTPTESSPGGTTAGGMSTGSAGGSASAASGAPSDIAKTDVGDATDNAEQTEAQGEAVEKDASTLQTSSGEVTLGEGDRPTSPRDSWQGATISDVSVIQFLESAKEMATSGDEDACQEQLLQAKMALGIVPSDTAAESHGPAETGASPASAPK